MAKVKFEDCGLTFQAFYGMSQQELAEYEKDHPFPYQTIEEYAEDVVEWLCESDWHYKEDRAREIVKEREDWIVECFQERMPVDLCGAEAGYCCG